MTRALQLLVIRAFFGSVVFCAGAMVHGASVETPWSFRPLSAPPLSSVKLSAWPRDDLDRYILAGLEAAQLQPNPDADRATLLRRLSFDLTGLPPTESELSAFVGDAADDDQALARMVDRLLASPRFGERWARHWLDVVRYADSVGRTYNPPFTYAWRYRDYVIDALNEDKPYDRFLTEQLAGDLLPAKSVDERRANLTATGLLALGPHDLQGLDRSQFHLDCIDDQIDVTTRSMLGLTIACARCHDHKYDPIATRDYYALAGVFYSTRMLPGVSYRGAGNGYVDHEQLVVLPIARSGRQATPTLAPGVHSMNDFNDVWRTGERKIRFTTDPNLCMGVAEDTPTDCEIRIKGDPHDRGEAPPRGELRIPGLPRVARPASGASGRLEFARWVTSRQNPLTARVMANRVWQHLLGQGLVETPDDFGSTSAPPSHPELLDHLATQLMKQDWSLKKLIRSIVLSRTYRLSSRSLDRPADKTDPANRQYWRANLRRLEFEPLRDSLLAISGQLDLQRPDGIQVAGIGGKSMKTAAAGLLDLDSSFRTIYLPVIRSRVPDAYSTFDFPDPCQINGRREVTTVAPQALFFMNGRLVSRSADATAELLEQQNLPDDSARVAWLYRRVFARAASADETRNAIEFLKGTSQDRWSLLVQTCFCSAEFRYLR